MNDSISRGNELYKKGEYEEAVKAFQEILQSDTTNIAALIGMGKALREVVIKKVNERGVVRLPPKKTWHELDEPEGAIVRCYERVKELVPEKSIKLISLKMEKEESDTPINDAMNFFGTLPKDIEEAEGLFKKEKKL